MSKMPQVISIVRGPDQLTALISRQSEIAWLPIVEVPKASYPAKERLLESWRRLAEVKAADEHTLYDIFIALLETVPDPGRHKPAAPVPAQWNPPPAAVHENRRGLRKFLNAYWAGDRQYLSKHPATEAWYRKHDRIPRGLWERGIPFRSEPYSIEVERDPFEVLKLGTYVGSCLAIGGVCSDSAVAALLDANKHVLYARDGRNRVVARQLVAVSDQDSLVCFSVYPLSAGKEIKALFRDYDHAFAEALGLPSTNRPSPGNQLTTSVRFYRSPGGTTIVGISKFPTRHIHEAA